MSETDRGREELFADMAEEERYEDPSLESLYEWAARNVDYLTDMCLGPAVQVIEEKWKQGSTEPPWNDAGPSVAAEEKKDQEGGAA